MTRKDLLHSNSNKNKRIICNKYLERVIFLKFRKKTLNLFFEKRKNTKIILGNNQ